MVADSVSLGFSSYLQTTKEDRGITETEVLWDYKQVKYFRRCAGCACHTPA